MTYEDGILKIDNAPQDAVLLHASYNDNGVLQAVKQLEVKAEQETHTKNGDKFFLWCSPNGMIPLCETVEVIKSEPEPEPEPKKDTIVVYFSFQGSTGISGSLSEIKNAVPNSTVKDGFRGTANMTEDQIKSQLEDNDYEIN